MLHLGVESASVAPHEIIKKLFSAQETPDIFPVFLGELVKAQADGTWKIPIAVGNNSSVAAEDVSVSVTITEPSACDSIRSTGFNEVSHINPGRSIFMRDVGKVLHRGLNIMVGELLVKMKTGRRPKRKLDLEMSLYANKMRAKKYEFSVHLAKSGFKVVLNNEKYLY